MSITTEPIFGTVLEAGIDRLPIKAGESAALSPGTCNPR